MGYPPPPPPPGAPGGYGPPAGAPPGGYGPPPGHGPLPGPPPSASRSSKGTLLALVGGAVAIVLLVGVTVVVLTKGDGEVALTEDQLEDALIDEGDVDGDYSVDDDDDEDDIDIDDLRADDECIELFEQAEATEGWEPDREAGIKLQSDDGSTVDETLSQGSRSDLGTLRQLADRCPEVEFDDGENEGSFTFELVDDVVELDAETLTMRIEIDLDEPVDATVTFVDVYWVRDGTHVSVSASGPLDPATMEGSGPDEDLLRDVVARADERLAEVIDQA